MGNVWISKVIRELWYITCVLFFYLNVCAILRTVILTGNSTDKDMHYERTRGMEARKYLRKCYCHRIKYSATNFLVALMRKRLMNSVVLATPTHRGPEEVFDETSTQVMA